ncbi:MAG: DHA2 family efflux MFS transporter permease subunit [Nevskiaceae bacterium]|nr:MAG: DHA2 family efflux MFS transporter permease subunit [Nevskiaceae bacterium]TAM33877.1 MAG: DHA2 family efflux MFS transporter permease subunit [Nevskiaceae bacterium]
MSAIANPEDAPPPAGLPLAGVAISERRKLLVFAVMALGMFMALLDIQIVAASLPEVVAGLSAGTSEGSWVQTAYLIAEIVMIPLSGFLSRALSTRWLFTASAAAFTVSSIACGLAWNLEAMVLFRAIQGFVGGAMIPTAFASGFLLFQGPKQALIPAILGITGTLAPTLGPTLGGWITQALSWHWLFFLNVVPGVLICVVIPLYGRIDAPDPSVLKGFDPWGIPLLALFLGTLQYLLEEGPRWDWLADPANRFAALVSTVAGTLFFWRSFSHPRPVVDLRIFSRARFAIACLFQFVLGVGLFTSIYLVPQFLAQVRGYRSLEIGEAVFVTGLFQLIATPLAAAASRRFDPRHMIAFGFLLFAASMHLTARLSSDWGRAELFWPQGLRGFAMMFCIVPATNMALGGLPPALIKTASGLSNLMRSLGGAVGIALANTALNDRFQLHYARLGELLNDRNHRVSEALARLGQIAAGLDADPGTQQRLGLAALHRLLSREALTLSFADCFLLLSGLCLAVLLVLPLSRPIPPAATAPADAH